MPDRIVDATPIRDKTGNLIGLTVRLVFEDAGGNKFTKSHIHPRPPNKVLTKDPATGKPSFIETGGEKLADVLVAIGYDPVTKKPTKAALVAFEKTHFTQEKAKWATKGARPVKIPIDSAP